MLSSSNGCVPEREVSALWGLILVAEIAGGGGGGGRTWLFSSTNDDDPNRKWKIVAKALGLGIHNGFIHSAFTPNGFQSSLDWLAKSEEKQETNPASDTSKSDSPQPVYNPNCQWLEDSDLNVETLTLATGASLQLAAIPPGVLGKADLSYFYCCTQCGKVFWEGSHFGRVVSQFKEALGTAEGSQSFYELS